GKGLGDALGGQRGHKLGLQAEFVERHVVLLLETALRRGLPRRTPRAESGSGEVGLRDRTTRPQLQDPAYRTAIRSGRSRPRVGWGQPDEREQHAWQWVRSNGSTPPRDTG